MARVLIDEFEEDSRTTLCDVLEARGHAVYLAAMREAGVAIWKSRIPDVVVVDIATAESDAFDPWRTLKETPPTSRSKLLLMTRSGRAPLLDTVDAVLEKPFRVSEFCARVEALAHVRGPNEDETIVCGNLRFERRSARVVVAGEEVNLTTLEHKLLVALYDRRPTPMSRPAILHSVWKMNEDIETRTIDTHVRRLRVKLGDCAGYIVTVRGVGFAFDERALDGASAPPA